MLYDEEKVTTTTHTEAEAPIGVPESPAPAPDDMLKSFGIESEEQAIEFLNKNLELLGGNMAEKVKAMMPQRQPTTEPDAEKEEDRDAFDAEAYKALKDEEKKDFSNVLKADVASGYAAFNAQNQKPETVANYACNLANTLWEKFEQTCYQA